MAAVDSLIRLIAAQNADSLTLSSEQVPRLSRAGAAQPLSMPPVGAAMMDMFVAEVLTPPQIDEARAQGALTVEYGEFTTTVKRTATGWSMSFKKRPARRGAAAVSTPSPAPAPAHKSTPAHAPAPGLPAVPAATTATDRCRTPSA